MIDSAYTLEYFDNLPSTNTYLKENVDRLPDMTAVMADLQTGGRGRLGHTWIADRGCLAVSLLIKNRSNTDGVTPLCSVAVVRMLKQLYGVDAGIKWINDVIYRQKKVCGILCESVISGDKTQNIICGIGVNLNQSDSFFAAADLPNAASMYTLTGVMQDKQAAAKILLDNIAGLLNDNIENIMREYSASCITLNKNVRLIRSGETVTAYAKGLTPKGELICQNDSGEFIVNSGEVQIRSELEEYV